MEKKQSLKHYAEARLKSVIAVIIQILKPYIRTSPSRGPPCGFSLMSPGCEA